ncbi:hypothetical protein ABPG75_002376 [Micractinium tetrahymenae]
MDFDRYRKQSGISSGRAVREQSSSEVLNQAKAERAARQAERQRQRAASTIGRWWRGTTARRQQRSRLRQAWLQEYGPLVAQPQELLPAAHLVNNVLPPVLAAFLPGPCQQEQRAALAAGAPLPPLPATDTAALRGCFALLLRSLAATEARHNLLGLGLAAGEAAGSGASPDSAEERQQQLLGQLQRLLLLCCSLIGSGSNSPGSGSSRSGGGGGDGSSIPSAADGGMTVDPLLQAAAGRLVSILCDSSLWKCFQQRQPEHDEQQRRLQQGLHSWLAPLPLLSAAAQRLVAVLSPAAASQGGGALQQQDQQRQQLTAVLNGLVAAQLALWRQLQKQHPEQGPEAAASSSASGSGAGEAAGRQLLRLLATPGLLPLLAPSTVAQLIASPGFAALLRAAASWQPGGDSSSGSASGTLSLLGTLAQLAAGKRASQPQGQQGRQVDFLPPSQLLQQPGVASALGAAAAALLQSARDAPSSSSSTGGALEPLWPFSEGTFASQLLAALPLPQFARLYHELLLLADACSSSSRGAGGGGGGDGAAIGGRAGAARLLSALAFGTQLLTRLWRELATSIGLPLEAPLQATRGWEVATLRRGIAGLQPQAAAQLGLFCRVYCHHLQVVDDWEFHERQQTFSLGQQRAIAAALNTLIFRTQLPDTSGPAGAAAGGGAVARAGRLGRDHRMLQQAAPLLHRALYERDARRPFCPPALWLEPYRHLVSAGGGSASQPISGAAVVRALVAAADGDAGGSQHPGAPSAAHGAAAAAAATAAAASSSGAGVAAASRPAAVAAILTAAPQCVPFEERVAVFRALIEQDQERCGYNLAPVDGGARPVPVTIRRGYVLEDASAQLGLLGSATKSRLSLTFINQQGLQEAGIDMGGLMKEFLESVVAEGFDPNRGLFSATPDGYAYPNPLAERLDGGLAALEALGLVLGRALYEGLLLDLPLAPFFVSRLQGRWPLFDELQALDPEVYRSLMQLKRFEGQIDDLCLDFTVESDFLGSKVSEELVPGGSRLGVNNGNVLQYVYLVADWHLNKRLGTAAAAFSRGLSKVIPPAWLRLFSPREVNQLLGGGEAAALDVDDMQAHAQYSNGYSASSTTVKHFWAVVRSMSQEEQRALLKFVTSVSRAPLGGFKHLTPPLTIHKVDCGASLLAAVGGKDVDRLPTASTCSNTLKLPNFRRTSTLREKLLYAIKSGAGFELS